MKCCVPECNKQATVLACDEHGPQFEKPPMPAIALRLSVDKCNECPFLRLDAGGVWHCLLSSKLNPSVSDLLTPEQAIGKEAPPEDLCLIRGSVLFVSGPIGERPSEPTDEPHKGPLE